MKLHAPQKYQNVIPLCGERSVLAKCAEKGDVVNCPDCRVVINHIRANFGERPNMHYVYEPK